MGRKQWRDPMRRADWRELDDREQLRQLRRQAEHMRQLDPAYQRARRRWQTLLLLIVLLVAVAVGLALYH